MNFSVNIKEDIFWKKYVNNDSILWIKGYMFSHNIDEVINVIENIKINEIESFINSIDGRFSLAVIKDSFSCIAVDKIRSSPLFWIEDKNIIEISNDPNSLLIKVNGVIDNDAKLTLSMSGYTTGHRTIYKELNSLLAGEVLIVDENNSQNLKSYHIYKPWRVIDKDYNYYLRKLECVTLSIFKKLLINVGSRQIVVPLSAGNDSRLVVSCLKHLGAKNVVCISYGSKGNFESKISKNIAKKLGYKWYFHELNHSEQRSFYNSIEFDNYFKFANSFISIPFFQGLSTVKYLRDNKLVDEDAVFIDGGGGDYISGGHIKETLVNFKKNITNDEKIELIHYEMFSKHFDLWQHLKTNKNSKLINTIITKELEEFFSEKDIFSNIHGMFEYLEFYNRQSKYINSGQRCYEFYGFDWRLPLWDDEYIDFWEKVPVEYKFKQKLYIDMLQKTDWGGVWSNSFGVNDRKITPFWIVPFRFFVKIFFVFFGQKGKRMWKQFDISFFHYWMNLTHQLSIFSYFYVVKGFKNGGKNLDSYVSKKYVDFIENRKTKW